MAARPVVTIIVAPVPITPRPSNCKGSMNVCSIVSDPRVYPNHSPCPRLPNHHHSEPSNQRQSMNVCNIAFDPCLCSNYIPCPRLRFPTSLQLQPSGHRLVSALAPPAPCKDQSALPPHPFAQPASQRSLQNVSSSIRRYAACRKPDCSSALSSRGRTRPDAPRSSSREGRTVTPVPSLRLQG